MVKRAVLETTRQQFTLTRHENARNHRFFFFFNKTVQETRLQSTDNGGSNRAFDRDTFMRAHVTRGDVASLPVGSRLISSE